MKKWQKQIGWTLVGAFIVAIIAAFFRKNRDFISSVPIAGDVFNYVMPETGFAMPGINIPGLTLPDFGGVTLPERREPMAYPPANSCGCGTNNASEIVESFTPIVDNTSVAILPPAIQATYTPPPCVMQTDWNALTAPGTVLGNWLRGSRGIKQKHYNELVSAGYQPSPAGWARYVVDYPRGIGNNQNRTQDRANILNLAENFQRCM